MLYLILPAEVLETHVTQFVTAAKLDTFIHITPEDFPPLDCKNLLFPEIIHGFEIAVLIAQVMDIAHQIAAFRQHLYYFVQQLIKLLPSPAKYRKLCINLKLPDIHYCLLYVIQIGGLYVKCTDTVEYVRLLAVFRFPAMQHRERMEQACIKVLLPHIMPQRER